MATATGTRLRSFIDGELVDAAEGAAEPVTNPATGEEIAEMPLSTGEYWPGPDRRGAQSRRLGSALGSRTISVGSLRVSTK